jgi:hypothetical protein
LQTGGGLALNTLCLEQSRSQAAASIVGEIRALTARLQRLRDGMANRLGVAIAKQLRPQSLLDIGSGLAPWSIAVAKHVPELQLTVMDLPAQAPLLEQALNNASLNGRFSLIATNALVFDFSSIPAQDVTLIANVCHVLDARRTSRLLAGAIQTLRPGGFLLIIDQVLDDAPDWSRWGSLYAVGAPHWLPGGHLFTHAEYWAWLEEAGASDIRARPICAAPEMTMISARAPHR